MTWYDSNGNSIGDARFTGTITDMKEDNCAGQTGTGEMLLGKTNQLKRLPPELS